MQYRDLLSEKSFLKVQQRARALNGTDLVAIYYRNNELLFKTRSGTDRKKIWTQRVIIDDITVQEVRTRRDLDKLILNSNLHVSCDCIAKGTRIKIKEGYKNIEDVNTGDEVLNHEGKFIPVISLLKSEKPKEFVSIRLKGEISPLVISKDHKVLVSTFRDRKSVV